MPEPISLPSGPATEPARDWSRLRYRVEERRDIRAAVRVGSLIGMAILVLEILMRGFDSPVILVTDLVGIAALALLFTRRASHHPHPAAFAVVSLLLWTSILPEVLAPTEGLLLGAYLVLVVVAAAVFVPWSATWHRAFLAVAFVSSVAGAFFAARGEAYVIEFTILITAAITTSFGGNMLVLHRRERSHRQQMALREQRAELQRVQRRLRVVASEDSLTGLGNRRKLTEDVTDLEARLARGILPGIAALMIDLDHFKAYNDRAGHPAGDEVLRIVSAAVRGAVREVDRVYRYGGEELLVIVEDPSRETAGAAAERIAEAVHRLALPHVAQPGHIITVSVGAASQFGPGTQVWQVIEAADRALYDAKDAGRDRVRFAPALPVAAIASGRGPEARTIPDTTPDTIYASGAGA